jgi:hypothetical protein
VTFSASVFLNRLNADSFKIAFEMILNTMKQYGCDMNDFFCNLESITTHFSQPQNQGITSALHSFVVENSLNLNQNDIDQLMNGCLFHWKQWIERIKTILNKDKRKEFE